MEPQHQHPTPPSHHTYQAGDCCLWQWEELAGLAFLRPLLCVNILLYWQFEDSFTLDNFFNVTLFQTILNCSRLSFLHLPWLLFQQLPVVPCHQDIQGLVSGHTTGRCFQAFCWCSPTVARNIFFMERRYNLTADSFCV